MIILDKIINDFQKIADHFEFQVHYTPGVTEDLDKYKAYNKHLNINVFASTEERAINSARRVLVARMLQNSSLEKTVLKLISLQNLSHQ